jgi:phytoene dehydrogenase-like protein
MRSKTTCRPSHAQTPWRNVHRPSALLGDFTHGLIHPEQMMGDRLLVPGSAHATPIANLYLCGASCHPGPGVTFLPGYGAAYEVAAALGSVGRLPVRSAA